MTEQVLMAADGMPSDPWLRIQADRLMARVHVLRGRHMGGPADMMRSLTPFWARGEGPYDYRTGRHPETRLGPGAARVKAAMPGLVAAMRAAGHFDLDPEGRLRVPQPASHAARPVEKKDLLATFAAGMAARRSDDPARQEAIARLFLDLRALARVHATFEGGLSVTGNRHAEAILIPSVVGIEAGKGPVILGGDMILRGRDGQVYGRWAPPSAIAVEFPEPGRAVVTVSSARCKAWRGRSDDLLDIPVSGMPRMTPTRFNGTGPGWRGFGLGRARTVPPYATRTTRKRIAEAVRRDRRDHAESREAVAGILGFDMGPVAWRSFAASVRRSRPVGPRVVPMVGLLLDPEVRRACLRSPRANLRLANWLAGPDAGSRERRLQASAAYPVLTPFLHLAQGEIDAGGRLAPALSRALGLHPLLVRRLGSRPWQVLGKDYDTFVATPGGAGRASALAALVPPERLPATRPGWKAFMACVPLLHDTFGWPEAPRLARDMSADWGRTAALMEAGVRDAVRALADAVMAAIAHTMPAEDPFPGMQRREEADAARKAVVEAVLGPDGGMAALERFNDLFHRGMDRRAEALRQVEAAARHAAGLDGIAEPVAAWLPMTPSPFACASGAIEWVCQAADLAAEGTEMEHCVRLREGACRQGTSHVGRVRGADGGRSTVDFDLGWEHGRDGAEGRWRVTEREHKARRNAPAPADCLATVEAFLDAAPRLVDGAALDAAAAGYRTWRSQFAFRMPPEFLALALLAYDDCLPSRSRSLGAVEWERRVRDAVARRPGPLGSGASAADRHALVRIPQRHEHQGFDL